MSTSIRYVRMYLHCPRRGKMPVAYLSQYGDILRVSFDDAYIKDPTRPTLSLCYRAQTDAATQQILTAMRDIRLSRSDGHWPAYFQNLLPEAHNRERLAKERGCSTDDEFELLAAAGHDLMGAVEVEPVPLQDGIPDTVRHWHTALGLDVLEPGFVEFPVEDAAALPGVITKFSAVLEGRRYVVKRHGAAGEYILKLPTTRHPDLVANEAMGYRLCRAMGLDCANARIISRDEADVPEVVPFEPILAVERFDRGAGGKRIHIEEFAQALQYEPQHKYGKSLRYDYANMLRVLEHLSGKPAHDVPEFIRRFIVFVLMGNTDAHLKNWALRYPDGVTPELAPLYDPVCVAAYFDEVPATDYGINRVIDKTVRAFTWNDLESLLREAGLLRKGRLMNIARDTVRQAQSDWPALLAEAPLNIQKSVTERLNGGVMLAK